MANFVIGVIFGIVAATVGLQGIAKIADRGVDSVKSISQTVTK